MKIIKNISELKKKGNEFKKKNSKVVLVHGVFDLIHPGHIDYFKEAKSYGDILIASLTSDKYVKKGFNKPYFKENERLKFLSSIEYVDFVILNNDKDSVNIIKNLKPDFYVKGPDYKKKGGDIAGNLDKEEGQVLKNRGKLIFTTGKLYSSTKLLNYNFNEFNPAKKIIQDYFKLQKK